MNNIGKNMKLLNKKERIFNRIQLFFIKYIYADHNNSKIVKSTLKDLLKILDQGKIGLNLGSGELRLHDKIINLDIFQSPSIDIVGLAEDIPLESNYCDIIICQEALEHINKYEQVISEVYRVLKVDGLFYCQVPFIIGYHPGPTDFWRFTKEGIEAMLKKEKFKIINTGQTVGSASGYYRISVEFFALLFSSPFHKSYKLFKGLFAIFLYPIKYLDFILKFHPENDRIAGGYYIIAKKI